MAFKKSSPPPTDAHAILVLEPSKFERRCLCRLMRAAGAQRVAEAPDFDTARRMLAVRRWSPWVLVAEPERLGEEGFAELSALAGAHPVQWVLLLTQRRAPAGDELRARALQYGLPVIAVLRKPVSAEEAGGVLRALVPQHTGETPPPPLSASELNECLRTGSIQARFAPILNLHSGQPLAYEALPCVIHPGYGEVSEAGFRHALARLGAQRMMTAAVLREAASFARSLRAQQLGPRVAVNLAADTLAEAGDANALDAYVRTLGVTAADLVFEIDGRHAPIRAQLAENLARLKLRGYLLALDGPAEGTELSHPGYEHFGEIKLLWSGEGERPSASQAQQLAAVARARKRGVATCALGLRRSSDLEHARAAGFDRGQGELFAAPMAAAEALPWCDREERSRNFADRTQRQNRAG